MSTWTTPATWVNSIPTAAQMNTEIRDHLNFVKGALDLLTNSTTADTGTAMRLQIARGAASDHALDARVSGDTNSRFWVEADGTHQWGSGSAAPEINLYRYGAGPYLATDDDLRVRILRTSQTGDAAAIFGSNWVSFDERSNPGGGGADSARLYARDNGAGKTQLCVVFNTGAVQVLATQL